MDTFVRISLKILCCRAGALPSLYGYALVGHFYSAKCTCVRITIDAHAQYYLRVHFCEKASGVLFVLFIMPPNKVCPLCQAVVPPRQTFQTQEQERNFCIIAHYLFSDILVNLGFVVSLALANCGYLLTAYMQHLLFIFSSPFMCCHFWSHGIC